MDSRHWRFGVLVCLVCLIVLTVFFLTLKLTDKLSFKKASNALTDVVQITGVEGDECLGHYASPELSIPQDVLVKCQNTKFSDSSGKTALEKQEIARHNRGEICLTGCLMHWADRRDALYNLLSKVSTMCKTLGVPWVLFYGGLLGYYRSKELLPWDTDLDILMPFDTAPKFDKNNVAYEDASIIFKGCSSDNCVLIGKITDKQTLLFCDVFFWKDKGSTVEISQMAHLARVKTNKNYFVVPRDKFFPIQHVTMKGISVSVPSDIEFHLKDYYANIDTIPYTFNNGVYVKKS